MAKGSNSTPPVEMDVQIERWPIERLIPRANNPRTHSREQVANIAASIREWGWTNPILVGADDDIIAGHARLLAARKLGMEEVPVIVLRHLSSAQRRALVIADNQLAIAGAGWDEKMLRIELAILHEEDYSLDLVGFDDVELGRLLEAQDAAPGLTDEDAVPEVQPDPVARTGDLFILGDHRLICGDCTQPGVVARLLGEVKPLLLITDPPYGIELRVTPRRPYPVTPVPIGRRLSRFSRTCRSATSGTPRSSRAKCWPGCSGLASCTISRSSGINAGRCSPVGP